jgi:hypothetical protein
LIRGRTIGETDILAARQTKRRVSAQAIEESAVLEFFAAGQKDVVKNPTLPYELLSSFARYARILELEVEQRTTMKAAQPL